ncbi:MAG: hypothetical protein H0W28_12835 [Pyrinomonadaceae bacterium]|nr:hypothetical protein [Pyrinomonadaceae bacterium]
MRRTIAFLLLLAVTVLWAACTTADNSNTTGNANVMTTPANSNVGTANTSNANVHANMNASEHANMNMGNANKKANANRTP